MLNAKERPLGGGLGQEERGGSVFLGSYKDWVEPFASTILECPQPWKQTVLGPGWRKERLSGGKTGESCNFGLGTRTDKAHPYSNPGKKITGLMSLAHRSEPLVLICPLGFCLRTPTCPWSLLSRPSRSPAVLQPLLPWWGLHSLIMLQHWVPLFPLL